MRKELIGILLFFLFIFMLGCLLSYSPLDPSIHNAKATGSAHNLFGVFGSYSASIFIGLFGLGAFWLPILMLFISIHFFCGQPYKILFLVIAGGLLLIVTTGSLLSFQHNYYTILGSNFSSGGIIGIPLKSFLVRYANTTGAAAILILIWIIGFILATRFSIINFIRLCWKAATIFSLRITTLIVMWKKRRSEAKNLLIRKKEYNNKKKKKIKIKTPESKTVKNVPVPKQEVFEFMRSDAGFKLPSVNLLDNPQSTKISADDENLTMQSRLLEKKLEDFGVRGKVIAISPGPVVTTFEYEPAAGIKINKIVSLTDDLALALRAISIRIVAPIPGKAVIGIEIPNSVRETVQFKEIVVSSVFEKSKSYLTLCLGKNIIGSPVIADLHAMPHLLIAGATGSGKSVGLNAMICSILYKAGSEDVKFIMIDPKRIELSSYNGIPHLITPVVTDVKKATNALFWSVREMEKRYEMLSEKKARNINQYNRKVEKESSSPEGSHTEKMPYIVIVIDELADLMMASSRDVEVALTRLAQMARAAGIHLLLATQRPSVDVLTGIIKANFPTRLSFQVSSKTDSRTIIDANGAENLLGNGDMLFVPPGTSSVQRIHGAFISEEEITRITEFLKKQKSPEYNQSVTKTVVKETTLADKQEYDEKYDDAVALITKTGQASISMIQRHLRIGYNRAARIIEIMEKERIVGPSDGAKPREVLVRGYDDMP